MNLSWMKDANLQGGPGMVEALIKGAQRELVITFMECGSLIQFPVRNPMTAPNGISVAHPVDMMTTKIEVCINRSAQRDHEDYYRKPEEIRHTLTSISEQMWILALDEARPGLLGRGSYFLSLAFNQFELDEPCTWPDSAHRLD